MNPSGHDGPAPPAASFAAVARTADPAEAALDPAPEHEPGASGPRLEVAAMSALYASSAAVIVAFDIAVSGLGFVLALVMVGGIGVEPAAAPTTVAGSRSEGVAAVWVAAALTVAAVVTAFVWRSPESGRRANPADRHTVSSRSATRATGATVVPLIDSVFDPVVAFARARVLTPRFAAMPQGALLPTLLPTLVLAFAPWALPPGAPLEARCLVAAVLAGFALVVVFAAAPLVRLAAIGAALPLSAALEAATHAALAARPLTLACIAATASAATLAFVQHRLWRAVAARDIERDDRIRALERERDAAVKADQEKSRFLAIASHDLRQPVHAIGLFAATLEKRLEGTAEEPLVRNLNGAIDGLDRSFNVMLDISRLDAGAVEPRLRHFPLRDLFRRLHMHFAGQAEQKGLGLRFSPGGKSISSDPQLLERVLGNLLQNAIRYTERGGIVVVARSTPGHLNVEIWDTGIGIRAADLHKVFDEFYQVGQRERMRAQGLGMGLAIVKRLVRLLGHELTVSSKPGKGTMFRLRIALGGLPEIQDVTAAADTLPMPILQPRTVLVLDDEEPIRDGLRMLLQEWGFEAVAAGSVDEALLAVAALDAPPDLILSDLHLGDATDGIGAIEAIRRRCGVEIAAMLITGDTSHAEIRRATESGHPLLFKPVQPRKLYDALRGLGS